MRVVLDLTEGQARALQRAVYSPSAPAMLSREGFTTQLRDLYNARAKLSEALARAQLDLPVREGTPDPYTAL
jgi:hypothetical protein